MARQSGLALLLAAAAVQAAVALRHSSRATSLGLDQLRAYRFRDFVTEYGRKYKEGSEEYKFREGIFDAHKEEIMQFRSGPQQSWQMGVNNFMDYTKAEKSKLLGYTGGRSRKPSEAAVTLREEVRREPVPADYMVQKPKAKLFDVIRDQGSCGSCWAQAAVSTLEGQLEATAGVIEAIEARRTAAAAQNATQNATRTGAQGANLPTVPTLSGQTIVSCTANPKHCGGTGGCGGATVELAYDMIRENGGLPFAVEWPYESGTGAEPACKQDVFSRSLIQIDGYTVLPSNKLSPLKQALVTTGGPVAVSVDASHWFLYWSGVYSDGRTADGEGEFTVNHAVTLMGYSEPKPEMSKKGLWKIKNSWGEMWGESGYIRIEMKEDEESHCGWDRKTHDGIACDGDPDVAWVCGSCGILYDSVYPTGVRLK